MRSWHLRMHQIGSFWATFIRLLRFVKCKLRGIQNASQKTICSKWSRFVKWTTRFHLVVHMKGAFNLITSLLISHASLNWVRKPGKHSGILRVRLYVCEATHLRPQSVASGVVCVVSRGTYGAINTCVVPRLPHTVECPDHNTRMRGLSTTFCSAYCHVCAYVGLSCLLVLAAQ